MLLCGFDILKWNVVWKRFIIYKREKGNKIDYLLGVYIRQKHFWIYGQSNPMTNNWEESKDWPKQLNRKVKLDSEENYQKIISLLNSCLKLL